MPFHQLLDGKRRPKIRIVLAHQIEHQIAEIVSMTPVAWPAAPS
jgi:hypothetical protein